MEKYNCILLVDDDPVTNFINFVTLSKMKLSREIVISRNGEEALHYINDYKSRHNSLPELILLDVLMPVMDGFEFLEKFETVIDPSMLKSKVVMLSTLFTNSDINTLNRKGYTLFLDKPLEKEKLMKMLEPNGQCRTLGITS